MLQLHNLDLHPTGATPALIGKVNLEVKPGEMAALVGPNGSGKSTILRAIMGRLKPLNGSIDIDRQANHRLTPAARAKLVSVVPTSWTGIPGILVEEAIAAGRYPHAGWMGQLRHADQQEIEMAATIAGVQGLIGRRLHTLSDGERQRVLMARAIAQQTPLILLDEPTVFLDYAGKRQMFELLHQLKTQHAKAILVATHEVDLIQPYVDRWLFPGRPSHAVIGKNQQLIELLDAYKAGQS